MVVVLKYSLKFHEEKLAEIGGKRWKLAELGL